MAKPPGDFVALGWRALKDPPPGCLCMTIRTSGPEVTGDARFESDVPQLASPFGKSWWALAQGGFLRGEAYALS